MTQTLIFIPFIIYMLGMVYIGYYYSNKKTSNSADFYLGGRQLGPWVAAMSAEASDMSSWLLMGLPGLAFITGLADPLWTVLGLGIGTYLNWLFVTKRLRAYTIRVGAVTIPEFFSKRYHDKRNILMGISAVVILVFFVPYTAAGFKAMGALIDSIFGWGYHVSMIIGALTLILYTLMGGFMAVSITDLVQSIVMTAAIFLIVVFALDQAGGFDNVINNASQLPGYLSATMSYDIGTDSAKPYPLLSIVSTMAWGLGYFGMPHILLRFMAMRSEKDIPLSRRIATIWVFISMFVAIGIGIIGYSVAKNGIIHQFQCTADSERTVIELSEKLAETGVTGALIAGVVLAGILACTMSTAGSQLLAAASSFSENILQDVCRVKINTRTAMYMARLTIAVISIIGMYMAWYPYNSIFNIVAFAWAGFGAAFGPVMLASLFWKRVTLKAAIWGMAIGGIMVFVWKYLVRPLGGLWDIYELLPAFVVSALVIIIVSYCTEKPSKEIMEDFEASRKEQW